MKRLLLILVPLGLAACEPAARGADGLAPPDMPARHQIGGAAPSGPGITITGDASVGVVTQL
ncbi:MAG: hypothetical protein AAGF60_02995 [Pseudomonadota bacterium]